MTHREKVLGRERAREISREQRERRRDRHRFRSPCDARMPPSKVRDLSGMAVESITNSTNFYLI